MSSNPFAEPAGFNPYGAPSMAGIRVRPGGITVVAVIAIVMGVLGLFTVCAGIGGIFINASGASWLPQPAANADPAMKAQFDMQKEMMEVQNRYAGVSIALTVVHAIVVVLLITGGIMCLRSNPAGRKLLLYTFLGVIAFELMRAGMQAFIQMQMLPLMEEAMNRAVRQGGGGAQPQVARMTQGIMIFGLVLGLVFVLIKVIIYGVCAGYLSKQHVVDYFEGKNPDEPFLAKSVP